MANSDLLSIWNDAIANIGAKTSIALTTEQSAEAAVCALRYGGVVGKIIRETDWNCLRRRLALVEVTVGAVWPPEWNYMFEYPADCFYVRGFDTGVVGVPGYVDVPYEVANDASAGKVILTNQEEPTLIYTSFALNLTTALYEAKFDASLRDAVTWALSAAIAGSVTGDMRIVREAKAEAFRSLEQARAANANESAVNTMDSHEAESLSVRGGYVSVNRFGSAR